MAINSAPRNSISLLEKANQFQKRLHLSCRRYSVTEITNKANTYSIFIGPIPGRSATMSSGNLLTPAKCYLNLAVTAVCAVTYNKIVPDSLPVVLFFVQLIEYSCISIFRRRVMYHHSNPFFFQLRRREPVSRYIFISTPPDLWRFYNPRRNNSGPGAGDNLRHRLVIGYTTA